MATPTDDGDGDYLSIETDRADRRRHPRTPIGVPARVHFVGRSTPLTVELRDASRGGCYFKGAMAPKSAKLAFGFILADQQVCIGAGRVLRVDRDGFAVTFSRTSEAFVDFLDRLSGPVAAHAA